MSSAEEIVLRTLMTVLDMALHFLGANMTRDRVAQKIDEWEIARLPSNTGFADKFNEKA